MTSMHDDGPAAQAPLPDPSSPPCAAAPAPIGPRLRAARESTGLARDEFARKAHIPVPVLADLEEGRLDRLGAVVFARGYLRSVARAAGLPDDAFFDALPAGGGEVQPLVAQRVAPATPRWVTRYATPVAYALLTAVVMVPLVYLARPTPQQIAQVPSLTPIDATTRGTALPDAGALVERAPVAIDADPSARAVESYAIEAGPPAPAAAPSPAPVMASLAPLPQASAPAAAGTRRVTLRLGAPSWVEFNGADGRRLEYALLPGGTVRDYDLTGSAELRIGNASAARLTVDGRDIDLAPLSSPNDVARVQLGAPGTPGAD